jgi:hypothetical protein
MPDLKQSLQSHDLGHLRIVAEMWGWELESSEFSTALEELAAGMLSKPHIDEILELSPNEARRALEDLLNHGGRIPWSHFTRQFGEVREMGPGRRDREQPHRHPISPAEILWYRGLLARDFFDGPSGPEEYAYIPDNLAALLPTPKENPDLQLGRPASKKEIVNLIPANDRILDDACTQLAALRMGKDLQNIHDFASHQDLSNTPRSLYPITTEFLSSLLASASLLDTQHITQPEPTRSFLESSRSEALNMLAQAWMNSTSLNELDLIPGLQLEGEWENDPLQARRSILNFLSNLPKDHWWSLDGFIGGVRENYPDFQRPAGDYDSWFIRDLRNGEYLRGFEHWDAVDGALIRYILTGPMHWLGFLDLASPGEGKPISAFRFSPWYKRLRSGEQVLDLDEEKTAIKATSEARLRVSRLAPRAARYQISRFCTWEKLDHNIYRFRITPASLEAAKEQGLKASHLQALLLRYADAVPPSLMKALERWEAKGTEVRLESLMVLRLKSTELLSELRTSRAARFLGDPLGPTTVIVKPGAWNKVLSFLAEMGYLGEAEIEE